MVSRIFTAPPALVARRQNLMSLVQVAAPCLRLVPVAIVVIFATQSKTACRYGSREEHTVTRNTPKQVRNESPATLFAEWSISAL